MLCSKKGHPTTNKFSYIQTFCRQRKVSCFQHIIWHSQPEQAGLSPLGAYLWWLVGCDLHCMLYLIMSGQRADVVVAEISRETELRNVLHCNCVSVCTVELAVIEVSRYHDTHNQAAFLRYNRSPLPLFLLLLLLCLCADYYEFFTNTLPTYPSYMYSILYAHKHAKFHKNHLICLLCRCKQPSIHTPSTSYKHTCSLSH